MTSPSVFEVVTYNGVGGLVRHNLKDLAPLPGDCRPVHELDRETLVAGLIDMRVPNVSHGTGQQDALLAYSKFLKSRPVSP